MKENNILIPEYRFIELTEHEKESEELFECFCRLFTLQYIKTDKPEDWKLNYNVSVASFVNLQICSLNIKFNKQIPHVWFDSQGRGSMMYWSYNDSKYIEGIDKLIEI